MKTTKTAGVRDAKAQLSRLVADARRGHEWIITQRGRAVAKIVPVSDVAALPLAERLLRLEESGVVERAPASPMTVPAALRIPRGLAQRLLQSDRA